MTTDFSTVLGGLTGDGPTRHGHIPDNWRQGRTVFGGIVAAMALAAARSTFPGETAPLRSAQVSFIGPLVGDATFQCDLLRKGRSASFVQVSVSSEGTVAAQCVFCFGAARPSAISYRNLGPNALSPEETPSFFEDMNRRPVFARNFEMRLAAGYRPVSGAAKPRMTLWVRHGDEQAWTSEAGFLALCDAPPPAAMSMLQDFAPISSMSWLITMLTDTISTREGWWLIGNRADHVADGYSSQAMSIWNRFGRPIAQAQQTVAVFG
ncbi:MAG: acyl-CoA thioesterase [Alphaproteobacteria bacterium]